MSWYLLGFVLIIGAYLWRGHVVQRDARRGPVKPAERPEGQEGVNRLNPVHSRPHPPWWD